MRTRNVMITALALSLVFGFTAAPGSDTASSAAVSPAGVLATNPIGTMSWLPVVANETTGRDVYRLVVVYDHSLSSNGQSTELIADGPWGMRVFTDSVSAPMRLDEDDLVLPMRLVGHSPLVTSLDDAGAPEAPSDVPDELPDEAEGPAESTLGDVNDLDWMADERFIGLAGDVTDGDCSRLDDGGPSNLSYAYSTTWTVEGVVEAEACQIAETTTTADGTVTTITEYVPGFWLDVSWPEEPGLHAGHNGHVLSEVWYGAVPGFSTSGPPPAPSADEGLEPGFSTSIRNPMDYAVRRVMHTLHPGAGTIDVCQGDDSDSGSYDEYTFVVPEDRPSNRLRVDLYPQGDWDLLVNGTLSGNFIVNESEVVGPVTTGQEIEIFACNYLGGPEAELIIGWL